MIAKTTLLNSINKVVRSIPINANITAALVAKAAVWYKCQIKLETKQSDEEFARNNIIYECQTESVHASCKYSSLLFEHIETILVLSMIRY